MKMPKFKFKIPSLTVRGRLRLVIGMLMLMLVAGGGVVSVWAFGRYQFMLARAVRAAERSTCSQCASYGVLEVVRHAGSETAPWLRVRCRKCGHEWRIE